MCGKEGRNKGGRAEGRKESRREWGSQRRKNLLVSSNRNLIPLQLVNTGAVKEWPHSFCPNISLKRNMSKPTINCLTSSSVQMLKSEVIFSFLEVGSKIRVGDLPRTLNPGLYWKSGWLLNPESLKPLKNYHLKIWECSCTFLQKSIFKTFLGFDPQCFPYLF